MYDRKEIDQSRRKFLTASLMGLGAMAGLPDWFVAEARAAVHEQVRRSARKIGPNDQIQIGGIGLGGSKGGFQQGRNDTRGIANHRGVKCIAVCDVDKTHLNEAAAMFGPDCAKYEHYQELLARPDIDAVVIGTPDHWHVKIAMDAIRAGKDVYCEKPLTLTIDEGKRLVRLWKQKHPVFQVGSQQRSDARFRLACELVRNGRIGKVHTVHANLPGGPRGGPFDPEPVPPDFNWEIWQGQTPAVDYVRERTHGTFRHWLEYSGGMMTDWGAHHNDIAQWGLGMDGSGPIAVESTGEPASTGCGQCYNAFYKFNVHYTYPGDITLITSSEGENGVRFDGDEGWIFVSRGEIRASDQKLLDDPLPSGAVRLYVSNDHHGNFVDCIRTRQDPICTAEIGHRSVSVCHIGNISLRLGGKKLHWDPKREMFAEADANALLQRKQRKGYEVV